MPSPGDDGAQEQMSGGPAPLTRLNGPGPAPLQVGSTVKTYSGRRRIDEEFALMWPIPLVFQGIQ